MTAAVCLTDESGDVDMGGWRDGYVPRVGEIVQLPDAGVRLFEVVKVVYRLTVALGPDYGSRTLTAFVFLRPVAQRVRAGLPGHMGAEAAAVAGAGEKEKAL